MRRILRLALIGLALLVGAVVSLFVVGIVTGELTTYRIPSSTMEPTLHCPRPEAGCEARLADRVIANRLVYHFRDPRRGEVIFFHTPPATVVKCGAGGTFVKRVIGLPGDVVEVRVRTGLGYTFVNGKELEEPYIDESRRGAVEDFGPVKVKPGNYFVMGDNRSQSCDSRIWGTVPRGNVIGKLAATYWPPTRISLH